MSGAYHHRNSLVLSSGMDDVYDRTVAEELARSNPQRTSHLVVSADDPDDVLDRLRGSASGLPARVGVLSIDEFARSASASQGWDSGPMTVRTVNDAGNLTELGIGITEFLSDWEANGPENLVVAFDSLTTLLQYTSLERVYQFVHVVTNRLTAAGGSCVCQLDPDAHDDQAVEVLKGLFDRLVEADEGEEPSVRQRPGLAST